jgi:hypothetical protein
MKNPFALLFFSLIISLAGQAASRPSGCDGKGNCYVHSGASGNGSGINWANACTKFVGACDTTSYAARGVTFWVAAGSYGNVNLSAPDAGPVVTSIISAIPSSHGPAADWSNNFAGQALFSGSAISSDYWTIDGQSRGGDWQSEYTLKFWNQTVKQGQALGIGSGGGVGASHIRIQYVEIEGTNQEYNSTTPCSAGGYCDVGIYVRSRSDDIYVGYSFIHDVGDTQVQANDNTIGNSVGRSWLFERNYFSRNHSGAQTADNHSEAFSVTAQELVVRYNYFQDIGSSGVITDASAGRPLVGPWDIYGNVWFWTKGNPFPGVGDGFVCAFGETFSGHLRIYNNTIADVRAKDVCSARPFFMIGGGENKGTPEIEILNNIFWNDCHVHNGSGPYYNWTVSMDYNSYYGATDAPNDMSSHRVNTPKNPFLDAPHANFRLPHHSAPGRPLSSPYDRDIDGRLRGADGTWDRGAFQFSPPN